MDDASDTDLEQPAEASGAGGAGDVGGCAAEIAAGERDGVVLGVNVPVVLVGALGWHEFVREAGDGAVVAGAHDAFAGVDEHTAVLGVGVGGAAADLLGDGEEVLVPTRAGACVDDVGGFVHAG